MNLVISRGKYVPSDSRGWSKMYDFLFRFQTIAKQCAEFECPAGHRCFPGDPPQCFPTGKCVSLTQTPTLTPTLETRKIESQAANSKPTSHTPCRDVLKIQMSCTTTKPTNGTCAQRRQISLGIHPVWSESSLSAKLVATGPRFLRADSEDADQTWIS